jgi:ATP/maltotriose-dependent transcriptional regulator MalT
MAIWLANDHHDFRGARAVAQGWFEEGQSVFSQAERHPLAVVGMAELSLDRGVPDGAVLLADRMLRRLPVENRTQRATALELAVRAKAAAGDVDGARAHLEELRSVAHAVPTSPLLAAASPSATAWWPPPPETMAEAIETIGGPAQGSRKSAARSRRDESHRTDDGRITSR